MTVNYIGKISSLNELPKLVLSLCSSDEEVLNNSFALTINPIAVADFHKIEIEDNLRDDLLERITYDFEGTRELVYETLSGKQNIPVGFTISFDSDLKLPDMEVGDESL